MDSWQTAKDLFNTGEYWECHEVLEPLWLKATGLDKHFYAGIILLAASLHKAHKMDSPRGGQRNYAKALSHLALLPDTFQGTDVRELEASVYRALVQPDFKPKL